MITLDALSQHLTVGEEFARVRLIRRLAASFQNDPRLAAEVERVRSGQQRAQRRTSKALTEAAERLMEEQRAEQRRIRMARRCTSG